MEKGKTKKRVEWFKSVRIGSIVMHEGQTKSIKEFFIDGFIRCEDKDLKTHYVDTLTNEFKKENLIFKIE